MTYTLYVKPVNHISKHFMEETFAEFGEVHDIYIPRAYKTKRRSNFGYVKYDDKHAAARAIEGLNQKILNGHEMTVEWAEYNPKTPEEMAEKFKILKEERERRRAARPPISEDELQYLRNKRKKPDGPLHLKYFTVVDYPPGIGKAYTPVYQLDLPPVGQRRTFFSWVYVPQEQIEKILKEEVAKQEYLTKRESEYKS
ncbi:hypothetical protein TRFO_34287 [Tritrichomonas foetus]|uniref:RRM domain-containing protein n=1 Tax=Tritrichomonas foetus TaxID=1144522 RepID=A0A1J4JKX6_9EUKA|nr:hypothetical protein TRFO_34287 [Tritrichomonas foetus]|eukprot:OHS99313.1 hypothetical protein TRFO_34287 [Tritrichomonas foetus]